MTNPTPPKPTVTAQSASMNVGARANGGFTNGAELSWVGEDGPEAIIPLGAKRRGRGLELYKQVGEILGVAKNAEGGVYGGDTRINSIYGGSAYHNNAYSAPVFNGDSVSYQTDIANGGAFVSSAHHRQNVNESQFTNAPISSVNQTAYDIQNNRAAAYRFVGGAISSLSKSRSETRGGDTYGGTEIYAAPVIFSVYDAGTRNATAPVSYAAHTSVYDSAPVSVTAYDKRYSLAETEKHITESNAGVTERVFPLAQSGTAYDIRNSRTAIYPSSRKELNSYAANTRNSSTLTYQNAYAVENLFSEIAQAGHGDSYGETLALLFPDTATAFDAQEAAGATFEAGAGSYPANAAESDSGPAGGAPDLPPAANEPSLSMERDGGFSGTVKNRPVVNIHLNVNVNPHFNIDGSGGQSADELEAMVRRCVRDMSDEISGNLAERLIPVFENMPMEGGA